MALPTRNDIIEILRKHEGKGKPAMRQAIQDSKGHFPDVTNDLMEKIIHDLDSYVEYRKEEE